MEETTQSDKTRRIRSKVEQMGVFFEKSGYPPVSGRVFAYLLLSEPPYRDFYEIQSFLAASKSSVSTSLNNLMWEGLIDYITFSGDRKRYFRVNPDGWLKATKDKIRGASTIKKLIEDVIEERSDSRYLEFNDGLQKVVDFIKYFSSEMEKITKRWEETKQ